LSTTYLPSWMTTPCHLSVPVYLMHQQVSFMCGDDFLHPLPVDDPWCPVNQLVF
jgi:hypothetical protein